MKKLKLIILGSVVVCAMTAPCLAENTQKRAAAEPATQRKNQTSTSSDGGSVNLADYDPDSTGTEDTSAAWLSALEDLGENGGGTLNVGAGKFLITATVQKNFLNLASKIIIRGSGSNSQVFVATGGAADALVFQNLEDLLIEHLVFVGHPTNYSDVLRAINIQYTRAVIRNCSFYGISANTGGAALIKAGTAADLTVEHCQFLGSNSSSAAIPSTGTILADDYIALRVRYCRFLDYGLLNGVYYSKTGNAGYGWITLLSPNAATPTNMFATNPVEISFNQFDEGAFYAVINSPNHGIGTTYWMKLAYNVINAGVGGGYSLKNIKHLYIEGGGSLYRSASGEIDAITLMSVEFPTIKNFWSDPETTATRLTVDSGTAMLRVIDSRFTSIVNNAQAWCIESGAVKNCAGTTVSFGEGSAIGNILKGSVTIDPSTVSARAVSTQIFTLKGAKVSDAITLNVPAEGLTAGLVVTQVSVAEEDTVRITFWNTSNAKIDEASASWVYLLVR